MATQGLAALPVRGVEADLSAALADPGAVVLTAPTGSGKTTQVPPMLLRAGIEGQILVLQPRRLAARMVATRVAEEAGDPLGGLVGYHTRHDRRAGRNTRILFLTEGLFLRRLLADPQLSGVGAVVLDEFHERSLDADLSLALCRRLRGSTRPDLRLVVMSATLDAETLAARIDARSLRAEGRAFDVSVDYLDGGDAPVWDRCAAALRRWLDGGGEGDVLIFLPGTYEIRRTVETCRRVLRDEDGPAAVLPLHGSLPPAEQDRAVRPGMERRIIVSTNVAETSITIDGIRCVIDSGLARVHRYDPARGVNALLVERISQSSAQQRTGRAGRTAPGDCLRLWPRSDVRPPRDVPEIERVDLSETLLQLAAFGLTPDEVPWIDAPPTERIELARRLLQDLGAVDGRGALTEDGRGMVDIPAHPRQARLLLEGVRRGVGARATVWAALIAERDICRRPLATLFSRPSDDATPSDLLVRERAFGQARRADFDERRCADLGLSASACRDVERAARQFERLLPEARPGRRAGDEALARSLLAGYGDHVARRRRVDDRTLEMEGRRRVVLHADTVVGEASLLVVVDTSEREAPRADGGGVHTVASLATAIDPSWIAELFPQRLERRIEHAWDDEQEAVVETEALWFGALPLNPVQRPPTDRSAAARLVADRVLDGQLRLDGWNDAVDTWIARCRCVAEWFPERRLLRYDEDDLAVIVHEIVGEATRAAALRRAPVMDHVRQAMSWADQQFVEEMAPEKLRLPGGHGMRIGYTPGEPPRGRARIQDFYGLTETPRVAGGRVPLLLEILAPNFRPAQVTDDLAGFWERTYPELRKELSRRYPKHEWR